MRFRVFLLGFALAALAAGCSENAAPDAADSAPGPVPPFAYSLYLLENKNPRPGADRILVGRPEHLERVYAEREEVPDARKLFEGVEKQFKDTGTQFAELTALVCALDLPIRCTPDWEFIDGVLGHSDGPGAMHLRQALADSFAAQARKRKVETTVVLAVVNALMTRGMVKTAVGKATAAAETRAVAGAAPRQRMASATVEARPSLAAEKQAAAAGAERLAAATGRLRAPRDVSAIRARLVEAEALETGTRQTAVLADLAKLRPSLERPPSGGATGEALWRDYVTYWERRFVELSGPDAKAQGVRPPLTWESYRAFQTRVERAMKFEGDFSARLREEAEKPRAQRQFMHEVTNPRMDEHLGLGHEDSDARTYVDQFVVDEATLESDAPHVETFSTKQRDFRRMDKDLLVKQVQADAREAMAKYGGSVEVRRPGHPLFGRRVTVKQVHLVYDKSLLPDLPNQRELIEKTAQRLGVTPHFHHAR